MDDSIDFRHEEISQLAKCLWEKDGQPVGRDMDYWLAAEGELLRRGKISASAAIANLPSQAVRPEKARGSTTKKSRSPA